MAKAGERRLALVIGNSDYKSAPLKNPVNDARAVAKALEATGFKVTALENLSQRQMFEAVRSFGNSLREDDVAMFYYAGHGMQVKDRNYLIPVEADIQTEDDIPYTSIDVNSVLDRMARARSRFNIVVLDACRNNPFARSFRSAASGLAQMEAPGGTLIAYATAPGKTASDGAGDNGLYTQHLLRHLVTPGLPVEIVFKRVREGVERDTKSAQTPWESSSLKGDFYFKPPEPVAQVASVAPAQQIVPVPGGVDTAARQREQDFAAELAFWDAVKASTSAGDYKAYLDQYPQGRFAALARARMASIEQQAAGTQQNREQAFWDSIKSSNNAAEYEAYVAQYPNGQFAALARVRISSLRAQAQQQAQAAAQAAAAAQAQAQAQAQSQAQQQAAAEARENTFWDSIKSSNNTAEYEAYLAQFPKGRFVALANARISALKQTAALAAAAAAAPKPAASPAPAAPQPGVQAPVQVAAIAPASVAAPVQAPVGAVNPQALPSPGDRWVYQASGATRVPGNRLVYQVRDVSADGVAESLAVPGDTRVRSAVVLGGDASFVQRSGVGYVIDFAPFLLAFNDPAAIKLPAEVIRDVAGDGIFQPVQFRLVPRVVGTTQVKVPAGTFEAIHVSLQGATTVRVNNGTLPGNAHFDIWYAPAAKRWVKLVARVTAGSSSMEDAILELAEFQLGTPGTANPLAAPTPQNRPATQVAVAAPSTAAAALSAAAAALSSLVPKEGDTWTYKHTDTISRVNDSMLVYRVKSVSPNEIEDVLTIPDKVRSPVALAFDAGFAYPVRTGVPFLTPEVAPYLQAFEAMPEGKEWKFSAPVNIQAGNFRFNNDMPFTAVVERREKVTVPAGSFDAIKVLVQGRRSVSGWGQVVFTVRQEVWYAPAVKRFVKLATQMYAGAQTAENTVDELVRYQLN